jgi:hypothetical protein
MLLLLAGVQKIGHVDKLNIITYFIRNFCEMGTGVKEEGAWTDHSSPHSAKR